ncbi:MAG: VOC family protein [Bdellovibrionales bacterium]|nr:VOC family protein [Bdellovibrionales bacterium]
MKNSFHLAIPVNDLEKTRIFYRDFLGAKEGRTDHKSWQDFNFFGHQLSCHLTTKPINPIDYNQVDHMSVPIFHFGIIVEEEQFEKIRKKLEEVHVKFLIKAQTRFKEKDEEHKTMFFKDPSGNCLEIKSFTKNTSF